VNGADVRLKELIREVAEEHRADILELEVMSDHVHSWLKSIRSLAFTIWLSSSKGVLPIICARSFRRKPEHAIGTETVGLDIGPSTIAVVGETQASLEQFCEPVARDHKRIRRLQRKLDRQRRANNPDCYDEQGRAIKGKRPKNKSRRQQDTQAELAELFRREAAHRKTLHGQMANRIIAIGTHIHTEKLSYRGFQKLYGKSISVRAPRTFLSILTRK